LIDWAAGCSINVFAGNYLVRRKSILFKITFCQRAFEQFPSRMNYEKAENEEKKEPVFARMLFKM
jgi:hypothetical protein